jgi:hypothetical protein
MRRDGNCEGGDRLNSYYNEELQGWYVGNKSKRGF